jgi:hypothetical protein
MEKGVESRTVYYSQSETVYGNEYADLIKVAERISETDIASLNVWCSGVYKIFPIRNEEDYTTALGLYGPSTIFINRKGLKKTSLDAMPKLAPTNSEIRMIEKLKEENYKQLQEMVKLT